MAANNQGIKERIEELKSNLNDKYAVCKIAAKKLVTAYKALLKAEEKKNAKNTTKNEAAYAMAENAFLTAKKEYATFSAIYVDLAEEILALYDEGIANESAKVAKKLRAAALKFDSHVSFLKDKLRDTVRDIEGIADEYSAPVSEEPEEDFSAFTDEFQSDGEEEPKYEEKEQPAAPAQQPQYQQPQYQQPYQPPYYPQQPYGVPYYVQYDMYRPCPPQPPQGFNIAPTSIDISAIVEDAVATAMNKFKAAFEKRADGFIDGMQSSTPVSNPTPMASGAIASMEEEIAENEKAIAEKLMSVIQSLKTVSQEITTLGAAYIELEGTHKDAIEAQRRVNDMQRALSRELQGVQASQKVINQDQATVSGEQAAMLEQQKANVENQKLLESAQAEVAEMQKTLLLAQTALEESVREVLASHKSVIATQQSIISQNSKNIELQRELSERQAAVTAIQKEVSAEHKQLARTLRTVSKNKASAAPKSEPEAAEKIALPEEVVLEELREEK